MRRLPVWLVMTACASTGAIAVIACTSETKKPSTLDVEDDDTETRRRDSGTSSSGGSSGGSSGDPGELEGGSANGRIYAHTPDTLYLFEPVTKKLTSIGDFDCLGTDQMIDIALDRAGVMYGTAFHKFVKIDPTNAKCEVIKEIASTEYYPNSLSFVPVGVLDPTKEVLVGYVQSTVSGKLYKDTYVRINTTNGDLEIEGEEGDLNPPGGIGTPAKFYDVAGDLIALINDNNRAYVILEDDKYTDAGAASTTNHLAEINPKTGTITKIIGPTNQLKTYGFAYWAGKGYGFSDDGRITEINMTTGATTTVTQLEGGVSWYGAGVTTDSPTQ